jgi:hypothetical protein
MSLLVGLLVVISKIMVLHMVCDGRNNLSFHAFSRKTQRNWAIILLIGFILFLEQGRNFANFHVLGTVFHNALIEYRENNDGIKT